MSRGFKACKGFEDAQMPMRSTAYSAGYDMFAYEDITIPSIWKQIAKGTEGNLSYLTSGERVLSEEYKVRPTLVKTGIKAYMGNDEVLELYNRSSNPKKGLVLANSVGIVDADYYSNEDNDGNIMFAFFNMSEKDVEVKKGDKIGQAIFRKYLLADNDNCSGDERKGGFGSTGE